MRAAWSQQRFAQLIIIIINVSNIVVIIIIIISHEFAMELTIIAVEQDYKYMNKKLNCTFNESKVLAKVKDVVTVTKDQNETVMQYATMQMVCACVCECVYVCVCVCACV